MRARYQNRTYTEYAIEADPGRLVPSFPLYDTYEDARFSADGEWAQKEGLPAPRVIKRHVSLWELADEFDPRLLRDQLSLWGDES